MAKVDLQTSMGEPLTKLLFGIGAAAAEFRMRAFLVGGVIRDSLLGIPSDDIDVMLEGEARVFVEFLRENWARFLPTFPSPGKPTFFSKYKTAKLPFSEPPLPGVQVLDFSSARGERYPVSGGIPEVFFADLESDLARRDYSVNALALSILPDSFSQLEDRFGGYEDIQSRTLRVLHEASYIDDPARMIRGVRLHARLGFQFESETGQLFRHGIEEHLLDRLPRQRAFDELRKGLAEKDPVPIVTGFFRSRILSELGYDQKVCDSAAALVQRIVNEFPLQDSITTRPFERWEMVLGALITALPTAQQERWIASFELGEKRTRNYLRLAEAILKIDAH